MAKSPVGLHLQVDTQTGHLQLYFFSPHVKREVPATALARTTATEGNCN